MPRTLKDIMTRNPEVVAPDTSLQEAARAMKDLDVGPLPVCDGEGLVGLLTDRDITVRGVAEGCDPRTTPVRAAMTQDVIYCYEDQEVDAAARLMAERQIRRLPILDRDRRLVGIVSLGDLAVDTDDTERSGAVLERVSEPAEPHR